MWEEIGTTDVWCCLRTVPCLGFLTGWPKGPGPPSGGEVPRHLIRPPEYTSHHPGRAETAGHSAVHQRVG